MGEVFKTAACLQGGEGDRGARWAKRAARGVRLGELVRGVGRNLVPAGPHLHYGGDQWAPWLLNAGPPGESNCSEVWLISGI